MCSLRSKGMKPEMIVRRLTHSMGYRYRLHRYDLPGRPDMIFPSRRKIIFIHGCFWHQHSDLECRIVRRPRSNLEYWEPKLRRNQERDREHYEKLCDTGWDVLTLWECEIRQKQPEELSARIQYFLDGVGEDRAGHP